MAQLELVNRHGPMGVYAELDDEDYAELPGLLWRYDGRGYVTQAGPGLNRKRIALHRWVLARKLQGEGRELHCKEDGHHIDRNPLNNRRDNLEARTETKHHIEHNRQRAGPLAGAYLRRNGRWQAGYRKDRVRITIGTFDTREEAIAAYRQAVAAL